MDFGSLLVERKLISRNELDDVLTIQRRFIVEGREPIPRLGEILIERGLVTEQQVADVLRAQRKAIFQCPTCRIQLNVEERPDAAGYKCVRCGTLLEPLADISDVRVVDTSVILIAKDPIPQEVQAAAADPARKMGKYVLLEEIGRGGAAIVHRAWDSYLHQYVALKFLKPPPETADPAAQARHEALLHDLLHEARHAIRMRHPNIVTIYDVGRIDRLFYIAMDYLNGRTLLQHIREARERGRTSVFYEDPSRFVIILRDICRAVHYAHTRQVPVIHCDLKPSNILIDMSWRPYVLDFGLARELIADRARVEDGAVRGTPSYMAPEQALSQHDLIDSRTDVYGLGTVLYELLVGRPPFTGDSFDILHKVVHSAPEPPSTVVARMTDMNGSGARRVNVPAALERICMRCLEKSPDRRYPNAAAVADDLDRVLLSEAHTERLEASHAALAEIRRPAPAPPQAPRPARSALPIVLGAAVLAATAFAAVLISRLSPRDDDVRTRLEEIRRRLDAHIAGLQVEPARQALTDVKTVLAGTGPEEDWLDRQSECLEWMRHLKGRLIEGLNAKRHRAAAFRLRDRTVRGVEIVHADDRRLVAVTAGATMEIQWFAIEPAQLTAIARSVLPLEEAKDRFALALYCHKTGQRGEAEMLARTLEGTELEIPARTWFRESPER